MSRCTNVVNTFLLSILLANASAALHQNLAPNLDILRSKLNDCNNKKKMLQYFKVLSVQK